MHKEIGNIAGGTVSGILSTGICAICGAAFGATLSLRGAAVATLAVVVLVALTVMSLYYGQVLHYGGAQSGSLERRRYDGLRDELAREHRIAAIYTRRLDRTLDALDRFFNNLNPAEQAALKQSGALRIWSGWMFDRCLLIAIIYPIATAVLVWAVLGVVGPAEEAMLLPHAGAAARIAVIAAMGVLAFCLKTYMSSPGWWQNLWLNGIAAAAMGLMSWIVGLGAAPIIVVVVCWAGLLSNMTDAVDNQLPGWAALYFLTLCCIATLVMPPRALLWLVMSLLILVSGAVIALFHARKPGLTSTCMCLVTLVAAYIAAWQLSDRAPANFANPLLLLLGVLTAVKAPFDWFSIGLTRWLLRRGIMLGGWWPLLLGLADAIVGVVTLIVLAIALVSAIIGFNATATLGGGNAIIDVRAILNALADPSVRRHPEYLWLYILLFATMLPSLANLVIGALSILRGVPAINQAVHRYMPADRAVIDADRGWIAIVLAAQAVGSVVIGFALSVALLWLAFAVALPSLGVMVVEVLRWVAALETVN